VRGQLGRHLSVVRLERGVADGELDDAVNEAATLTSSQAVAVDDRCEMTCSIRCRRQALEFGDHVIVQLGVKPLAKQQAERGGSVDGPRARLDKLPLDERERFAPAGIETRPDQPGRRIEADLLEMAQQQVHRGRPRPGVPDHDVAPAMHERAAASGQLRQIFHASLSTGARLAVAVNPRGMRSFL